MIINFPVLEEEFNRLVQKIREDQTRRSIDFYFVLLFMILGAAVIPIGLATTHWRIFHG